LKISANRIRILVDSRQFLAGLLAKVHQFFVELIRESAARFLRRVTCCEGRFWIC
jgi:hypothetical protein